MSSLNRFLFSLQRRVNNFLTLKSILFLFFYKVNLIFLQEVGFNNLLLSKYTLKEFRKAMAIFGQNMTEIFWETDWLKSGTWKI